MTFFCGDLVSWPYPAPQQVRELEEWGESIRTYGVVVGWKGDVDAYEVRVDVGTWWVKADELTLIWRPK